MPYIKQEDRIRFRYPAECLGLAAECAGDLNYIMTVIVHKYIEKKGLKYANVNEVIGAMECCKLELYRKVAAPYEDIKIAENGDVGLNAPDTSPQD